jgi:hypothetical protein
MTMEYEELPLRVIALNADAAKLFLGRSDEPTDLGLPPHPERYWPEARLWASGRTSP